MEYILCWIFNAKKSWEMICNKEDLIYKINKLHEVGVPDYSIKVFISSSEVYQNNQKFNEMTILSIEREVIKCLLKLKTKSN